MNITITNNKSLRQHNTLGVEASCDHFAQLQNEQQLPELLRFITLNQPNHLTIGSGSNLLFTQDFRGLIIHNAIQGIHVIKQDTDHVWLRIGAGEIWDDLVNFCVQQGYGGIENLASIPGTVGAAPIQNIGAYGTEFENVFASLEAVAINTGEKNEFDCRACEFAYRDSIFKHQLKNQFIITSITLRLNKQPRFNLSYHGLLEQIDDQPINLTTVSQAISQLRQKKLPDPTQLHNAGSFFKNPLISPQQLASLQQQYPAMPHYPAQDRVKIPAAWLIEQLGFKGQRNGRVGVYAQHALVLVNHQQGTGQEIQQLAQQIQLAVKHTFDIELMSEVNII